MAIATRICLITLFCWGCNSLISCKQEPPKENQQTETIPEVIEATPLPEPVLAAKVLPPQDSAPWIKNQFIAGLQQQEANLSAQGLWIQSGNQVLSHHQGSVPLSAASVTKIATTLAALDQLGPSHRFTTQIGIQGNLVDGVLQGNLVVKGGDDPFLVWEDAFAIAQLLEQRGIKSVTGKILIAQPFVMNFETGEALAGSLFKQALNSNTWSLEALKQFEALKSPPSKPSITVAGEVEFVAAVPSDTTWVVQHASLPLVELLKRMNRYSNNPMADQIANHLGGGAKVTEIVRSLTKLPPSELQFINGSGLGEENRITAQGSTVMFQTLSNLLQSKGLSLGDVLTIVGQDEGILDPRPLPKGIAVKSGTLNTVSALAGVIPTQSQGLLWFSIFNTEGNVEGFRTQQESLMNNIVKQYGLNPNDQAVKPTLDPNQQTTITQPL